MPMRKPPYAEFSSEPGDVLSSMGMADLERMSIDRVKSAESLSRCHKTRRHYSNLMVPLAQRAGCCVGTWPHFRGFFPPSPVSIKENSRRKCPMHCNGSRRMEPRCECQSRKHPLWG